MRDSFLGFTVQVHHKGGNSQAEMAKANALSEGQLNIMKSQLAMQKQQLGMVNPSLQAIIQNGGMLPAQQAAMTSQSIQGLGQQYQGLYGQLASSLAARGVTGGGMAGGGDIARQFGSLGAQEAGQQSELLNQIQLAKGQGLQSALGLGLGEGGMLGSQAVGFGGQGVSALGIGQQAGQAADQAQTGFWGSLMGGLAGLGGSAMQKGAFTCWVAAELYGGWKIPETVAIRAWLLTTWYIRPFTILYSLTGARWAARIRNDEILRRLTKKLFDVFLSLAHAG